MRHVELRGLAGLNLSWSEEGDTVEVYSRQTDCAPTAVGRHRRRVGVSDDSVLTEL